LGYPGGPAVERAAAAGDPRAVPLPRPLIGSAEPHFSFAGLKSAVLRAAESGAYALPDIAASFQQAVVDCLVDRTRSALTRFTHPLVPSEVEGRMHHSSEQRASTSLGTSGEGRRPNALVVAGGVAANGAVRSALVALAAEHDLPFVAPPLWLCTDNAAMIAWAGALRLEAGLTDPLDASARARWPLDPQAERARGAGVKA
jgi:N6-L-threonylcarbamoyladenine synthase